MYSLVYWKIIGSNWHKKSRKIMLSNENQCNNLFIVKKCPMKIL